MIVMPRTGETIKSRFNGREFVITHIGERMVVLETKVETIRFVTTIDSLRSNYDYAFNGIGEVSRDHSGGERYKKRLDRGGRI